MTATSVLHPRRAALAAFCLAAILAPAAPATALERGPYTLEILVDGVPVQEYAARGATYVEALAGREYSIRLRNNTGQRIAVALSVDGLNTIDAKATTARGAAKWILDPYQSITLEGWQTSAASARRFFFTTEPQSYGAWLGETRNLGIITAAVFRERRHRPAPIWREVAPPEVSPQTGGAQEPRSDGSRLEASPSQGKDAGSSTSLSDDHAATGIGTVMGHDVRRVHFDAEKSPSAVIDIRYEFREGLARLGIRTRPRWMHRDPCEDPLARRERSRGFEGMEFAPDPYRCGSPR